MFEVVPVVSVPPLMVAPAGNWRSPWVTLIVPLLVTGTLKSVAALPTVFWIVPSLVIAESVPPPLLKSESVWMSKVAPVLTCSREPFCR
jgi:hypothetical protein